MVVISLSGFMGLCSMGIQVIDFIVDDGRVSASFSNTNGGNIAQSGISEVDIRSVQANTVPHIHIP